MHSFQKFKVRKTGNERSSFITFLYGVKFLCHQSGNVRSCRHIDFVTFNGIIPLPFDFLASVIEVYFHHEWNIVWKNRFRKQFSRKQYGVSLPHDKFRKIFLDREDRRQRMLERKLHNGTDSKREHYLKQSVKWYRLFCKIWYHDLLQAIPVSLLIIYVDIFCYCIYFYTSYIL